MTAKERIDAALAALEKATPGEWTIRKRVDNSGDYPFPDYDILAVAEWGPQGVAEAHQSPFNAALIAAAPDLVAEVARLRADNDELNALFDMQYKRTGEATEAWRKANPGNDNVLPDLGNLLEWMLKDIARLRKWQQEAMPYLKEEYGRRIYRDPTDPLDRLIAEAQED